MRRADGKKSLMTPKNASKVKPPPNDGLSLLRDWCGQGNRAIKDAPVELITGARRHLKTRIDTLTSQLKTAGFGSAPRIRSQLKCLVRWAQSLPDPGAVSKGRNGGKRDGQADLHR